MCLRGLELLPPKWWCMKEPMLMFSRRFMSCISVRSCALSKIREFFPFFLMTVTLWLSSRRSRLTPITLLLGGQLCTFCGRCTQTNDLGKRTFWPPLLIFFFWTGAWISCARTCRPLHGVYIVSGSLHGFRLQLGPFSDDVEAQETLPNFFSTHLLPQFPKILIRPGEATHETFTDVLCAYWCILVQSSLVIILDNTLTIALAQDTFDFFFPPPAISVFHHMAIVCERYKAMPCKESGRFHKIPCAFTLPQHSSSTCT